MNAGQSKSGRVVLHVPVTDVVMSGYDENGSMYRTIVLGHRTFAKVVDIPLDSASLETVVLQINERDYAISGASRWIESDGQWQLETTLPAEDNQPLNDCLGDPTWTEIASGD